MAPGQYNSSLTRVQPFFDLAFTQPGWLAKLLSGLTAAGIPKEVLEDPGEVDADLLGPHPKGVAPRACYEYEVLPDKRLLRWYVQNPDCLVWPSGSAFGPGTMLKRRALIKGEPPGRPAVQAEALELIETRPASAREWWRFEGPSHIDCVLATDSLMLTVEGKRTDVLSTTTDWYPYRTQVARNLEAARQLAQGRYWGTLVISEHPIAEAEPDQVAKSLDKGSPHVDEEERAELRNAYLGNLSWEQACDRVGVPFDALPDTV